MSASESLLVLISEIKNIAVLNDVAARNAEVKIKVDEYKQQEERSKRALAQLKAETSEALLELEDVYYSSMYKTLT